VPSPAATYSHVVRCHDEAHGGKVRPLGRVARWQWRNIALCWTRQGSLRWSEVLEIARALGRDPSRPRDDEALRVEFARRLRIAAEGRPKFTPAQLKRGRLIALVRATLRP
jgi:hypothetical protein